MPRSWLRGIELAQWHRAGSIFLAEKKKEKKTRRNWASYVTLSWRTNVRASKRILTMYWPGSWRIGEPAQGHVAGSISARFFFFFAKKIEPASYEALSQLRGIEPATWHWASYVALSQQGSFELWASKEAVSQQGSFELHQIYIYIYIPMQSQPYNILNLGQNIFLRETRNFELERECEIYHSTWVSGKRKLYPW